MAPTSRILRSGRDVVEFPVAMYHVTVTSMGRSYISISALAVVGIFVMSACGSQDSATDDSDLPSGGSDGAAGGSGGVASAGGAAAGGSGGSHGGAEGGGGTASPGGQGGESGEGGLGGLGGMGGASWSSRETRLMSGWSHTCVLVDGGGLSCWGGDNRGQLGDGDDPQVDQVHTPVTLTGITSVETADGGDAFSCASLLDGSAMCWGYAGDGRLGLGDDVTTDRYSPALVPDLSGVRQMTTGASHACALLDTGTVKCWGHNGWKQLGLGEEAPLSVSSPTTVPGLSNVVEIDAGFRHTCALLSSGKLECWGTDVYGQIGDGDPDNGYAYTPTPVAGLDDVVTVETGEFFTCAVVGSGKVYCWGRDEIGQIGDGSEETAPKHSPTEVAGIDNAIDVALGNEHACAVLESGQLACWGTDYHGQLGDGPEDQTPKHGPILVPGLTTVVEVTARWKHTCVRLADDGIQCWGYDEHGQVGDGPEDTNNKYAPVDVIGFSSPD